MVINVNNEDSSDGSEGIENFELLVKRDRRKSSFRHSVTKFNQRDTKLEILKKEREAIDDEKKKKLREVELWSRAVREEEKI